MSCKLLNISEAVNLGIHSMRVLSARGGKMTASEIAGELKVSGHHLSKVMRKLVVANLVSAEKGPKGGFWLTPKQRESTLMDVYRVLEGDTEFNDCLMGESYCSGGDCIFGELLKRVRTEFIRCFSGTKVSASRKICNCVNKKTKES